MEYEKLEPGAIVTFPPFIRIISLKKTKYNSKRKYWESVAVIRSDKPLVLEKNKKKVAKT